MDCAIRTDIWIDVEGIADLIIICAKPGWEVALSLSLLNRFVCNIKAPTSNNANQIYSSDQISVNFIIK